MSVNADFELFRVFLEKACGILLGSNKQYLVSSRLNKLMEQQGIKTLGELVQRMQAASRWQTSASRTGSTRSSPMPHAAS